MGKSHASQYANFGSLPTKVALSSEKQPYNHYFFKANSNISDTIGMGCALTTYKGTLIPCSCYTQMQVM